MATDSFRKQVEYISALKRIGDIIHKWRWAGNRLGELEDAILHGPSHNPKIWTALCTLIAEFPDDPRAQALIYARLHAENADWERRLIARMLMEMVPRTPGALDELVAGFAQAGWPLTARTVIVAAFEQDTGRGPKLTVFEGHDEKKYPVPEPRADWGHRSVDGVGRMGDLQRRLLVHPGFAPAIVKFLRTRIGQPDQLPYPGLEREAYRAAVACEMQVKAEVEVIRILRRAIDRELIACGPEETDWAAGLTELRHAVTVEFDRIFAAVFGIVDDDAESIADFVLQRDIGHRAYIPLALEKHKDCPHKREVRERLEIFLLTSYVLTSENWARGAPGAEGPRLRAWNALRQMLWEPGDPDRFVRRLMAGSDTPRYRLASDDSHRNTEFALELPTPRNAYGHTPLTEVFVSRNAFAAFLAAAFPTYPVDLSMRFPDDASAGAR